MNAVSRSSALVLLGCALAVACGGDDEPGTFTACGGDLIAAGETNRLWNFSGVTLEGMSCAAGAPTLAGFLSFNSNGRYSVNAKANAWIFPGAAGCGFDTTYGGFYRSEGSKVCFAETEAALAATPCDESGHDPIARPRDGGADYCVSGSSLTLSTRTFVGLSGPALLTLTRAP